MGKKKRINQLDKYNKQVGSIIKETYSKNMEEIIQTSIIMGHTQAYEYLYNNHIKPLDNALLSVDERIRLLESLYNYIKQNYELRTGIQKL